MLVNYSLPLIFVKSYKTASTSTEAFLQAAFWGAEAEHIQDWQIHRDGFCTPRGARTKPLRVSQAISITSHGRLPLWSLRHLRRLKHHSSPEDIIPALGREFWNRSRKIVNIRNPFDLAVSLYYFTFRDDENSEIPSFEEWMLTYGFAHELRWITEPDPSVTYIRYENLEADLVQLTNSLGLETPQHIPRFKSGIRPEESRDYRDHYSQQSRGRIERAYGSYLDAFGYSF